MQGEVGCSACNKKPERRLSIEAVSIRRYGVNQVSRALFVAGLGECTSKQLLFVSAPSCYDYHFRFTGVDVAWAE